jgi:hypothetical protein
MHTNYYHLWGVKWTTGENLPFEMSDGRKVLKLQYECTELY